MHSHAVCPGGTWPGGWSAALSQLPAQTHGGGVLCAKNMHHCASHHALGGKQVQWTDSSPPRLGRVFDPPLAVLSQLMIPVGKTPSLSPEEQNPFALTWTLIFPLNLFL